MIEADIDRYGSLIRASYLADYMELLALKGMRSNFAHLKDKIEDRWGNKREILRRPDEGGDDEEELQPVDAFLLDTEACLLERQEILGELYPFRISRNNVKFRSDIVPHHSSYIVLLALTIAHAYKIKVGEDLTQIFEDIVARVLETIGFRVANVGAISRNNSFDFEKTILEVSEAVNIRMDPNAAIRRSSANDAGVDVLGHLDWEDRRPGRWTVLGQATCAKSDSWYAKIAEPKPPTWKRIMGDNTSPLPFLAVPHHVEAKAFDYLNEGEEIAVIDRPKLVPRFDVSVLDFAKLIEQVTGQHIDDEDW